MTLSEAHKIVFSQKPVFAKLYRAYGKGNWLQYANKNFPKHAHGTSKESRRNMELFTAFNDVLSPLLPPDVVEIAVNTLKKTRFVSSTDHHGILCHPFFTNSAFLRSYYNREATISFTCGGISMSNSSYPRGVFYYDQFGNQIRIPFISRASGNTPVYAHWELGDHFTRINYRLWKEIFGNDRGALIYLEIEKLVRKLLLDYHLTTKTHINALLFNENTRNQYIKNYDGILGAHTGTQKGTHLFWYIDPVRHHRHQLWIKGDKLVSTDHSISIPLEPENIRAKLFSYELLPSMALAYSIISFYYGITLGGGFSQIQYLGDMKKAYAAVFGEKKSDFPKTDIFTGEFVLQENTSLIDILMWPEKNKSDIIDAQLEKTSVATSLDRMMPEFVRIVT